MREGKPFLLIASNEKEKLHTDPKFQAPLLRDMAGRTQIFLLTHHEHLVDLGRQTLGEERFHLHRLNVGGECS